MVAGRQGNQTGWGGVLAVTEPRDDDQVRGERGVPDQVEVRHQQNVKTSPGPPREVMVPLVLLVHPDPPWSTFSVKFQKMWIRMDRSGPRSEIFLMEGGRTETRSRLFDDADLTEQ